MNITNTPSSRLRASAARAPTQEAYREFDRAYDHYNRTLFAGALPRCLITLHREGQRILGYFSHKRFVDLADPSATTDEIAMNPMHFAGCSLDEVLSTLVHEMVHLWQAHFGKPSRTSYHNKEWAAKMKAVGLQPSDTGVPGGKETGQRMTHHILEDGAFANSTAALLGAGFSLTWADAARFGKGKPSKSGNRVKYTCPGCRLNVWGKDGLNLVCGDCDQIVLCLAQEITDDDL